MTTVETWLADLGKAAESLGYGISVIEPDRIELHPYGDHGTTVVIRGRFLSGDLLRKYLLDQRLAVRLGREKAEKSA